jgi:hypothetical protein
MFAHCHGVTCFCFVASIVMSFGFLFIASYFVYCCNVYVYVCLYMYINYHNICVISCVRRTCVGPSCWPGCGSRPPGGVQTVNLASRVPRDDLEHIAVSECVLNKAVVLDIFLVSSFAIVFYVSYRYNILINFVL